MTSLERQPGHLQSLLHAGFLAQPVGRGEYGLGIDVGARSGMAERVGDAVSLTLPSELPAVLLAPARPGALPGPVLLDEDPACFGERYAPFHIGFRQWILGACGRGWGNVPGSGTSRRCGAGRTSQLRYQCAGEGRRVRTHGAPRPSSVPAAVGAGITADR